jgi:hypothetical protein
MGLTRILENSQAVVLGKLQDWSQFRRLPIEVYGQHDPGTTGDMCPGLLRIHCARDRIDIHEHRTRPDSHDGLDGRRKGVRDGDHLVPGLDAHSMQCKDQGIGTAAYPDRLGATDILCEVTFEGVYFFPAYECATSQQLLPRPKDLLFERFMGSREVEEWDTIRRPDADCWVIRVAKVDLNPLLDRRLIQEV